jgi:RimJ/RimL family protein N-acetyltransferase
MRIVLQKYSREYLEMSSKWLNDSEISKLVNVTKINKNKQDDWYNTLPKLRDYLIWGVSFENKPIGACGIKRITQKDCEYWGYIGEKDFWGIGLGSDMLKLMEEKAIQLELESVWLKVIKANGKAIRLYSKQGYTTEKETGDLIFMRKML